MLPPQLGTCNAARPAPCPALAHAAGRQAEDAGGAAGGVGGIPAEAEDGAGRGTVLIVLAARRQPAVCGNVRLRWTYTCSKLLHLRACAFAHLWHAGGAGGGCQLPRRLHLQSGRHRCVTHGCRSLPLMPGLAGAGRRQRAWRQKQRQKRPCVSLLLAASMPLLCAPAAGVGGPMQPQPRHPLTQPALPCCLLPARSAGIALPALAAAHARAHLHLHDLRPGRAARVQGLGLAGVGAGRGAPGRCAALPLLRLPRSAPSCCARCCACCRAATLCGRVLAWRGGMGWAPWAAPAAGWPSATSVLPFLQLAAPA